MQEILQKQKAIDEKEAELLVPDDNVEEEEQEEGTCSTRFILLTSPLTVFILSDKTTLYENAETVMRKVYAMTEELQQVRFAATGDGLVCSYDFLQSIASQHERTNRLGIVEREIKALKS